MDAGLVGVVLGVVPVLVPAFFSRRSLAIRSSIDFVVAPVRKGG